MRFVDFFLVGLVSLCSHGAGASEPVRRSSNTSTVITQSASVSSSSSQSVETNSAMKLMDMVNGVYNLYSIESNKFLSFQDGLMPAKQYSTNPNAFLFQDAGNGYVKIISLDNGLCLDDYGSRGDTLALYSCHGGENQKWLVENASGFNANRITSRVSGKRIDLFNGLHNDGATVTLWPPTDSLNQVWEFVPIAPMITDVGCFADNSDDKNRAFRKLILSSDSMTIEKCAHMALFNRFHIFGIENGRDCWVTEGFPTASYKRFGTSSNCNMKCSGGGAKTCGGPLALSTYQVYQRYLTRCGSTHCQADNGDWCQRDQNLVGCLNDRRGSSAGDGRWCRMDGNYWGCLGDHGGVGPRAGDGTWCRWDSNTYACLFDHAVSMKIDITGSCDAHPIVDIGQLQLTSSDFNGHNLLMYVDSQVDAWVTIYTDLFGGKGIKQDWGFVCAGKSRPFASGAYALGSFYYILVEPVDGIQGTSSGGNAVQLTGPSITDWFPGRFAPTKVGIMRIHVKYDDANRRTWIEFDKYVCGLGGLGGGTIRC